MRHPESIAQMYEREHLPFGGFTDKEAGITRPGRELAERTGKALYERYGPFDVIIHSEFWRTYLGMQCLLQAYPEHVRSGVRVVKSPLLNERDLGRAFGLNDHDLKKRYPKFVLERRRLGDVRVVFPEGESYIQMFERIACLAGQFTEFAGMQVGLVGHFGTYFGLLNRFEPIPHDELHRALFDKDRRPKNCSLLILEPEHTSSGPALKVVAKNLMLAD